VTTLATGASPAEHGIIGWHLNLGDLGLVSTILLARTRTRAPMASGDLDLGRYLAVPSHLATVRGRRELLTYGPIAHSRFTRAVGSWGRTASYTTLRGMNQQVLAAARRPGRGLAYAYWPAYDTLCHDKGCFHRQSVAHLEEIDEMLGRLVARLRGTDTTLLVLSDHGIVDVPHGQSIDLGAVPGFYDCLATLPAGDSRHVLCFVRPARVKRFLALVETHLAAACVCVRGDELLERGVYGPGQPHPALENRVGDFALLARDGHAFTATVPGFKPRRYAATHGGMSAWEMLVPLYVVQG
jgi:hypothetical protein